jgi:hypothetical protein
VALAILWVLCNIIMAKERKVFSLINHSNYGLAKEN